LQERGTEEQTCVDGAKTKSDLESLADNDIHRLVRVTAPKRFGPRDRSLDSSTQQSQVHYGSDGSGYLDRTPNCTGPRTGPFRVRIEARLRWVASARVSRRSWFEADPECSVTETKDDD
jgi:hypothetical protein